MKILYILMIITTLLSLKLRIIVLKNLLLPYNLVKGIKLENVSFSYPNNNNEIIKDVTFNIKPGEKLQ